MTRFVAAVLLVVAACGDSGPSPSTPQLLELERFSPRQHTSYDVFLAARGDVVIMARRISRDGGATWTQHAPQLGELGRVAITGSTVATFATQLGLARWDLISDAIQAVTGEPAYTTDRTWRVDPTSGQLIAFDAVENAVSVERGGSWTSSTLPQPAPTELRPYIKDLESNGTTLLTISGWGIHRSTDNGTSWQLVTASLPSAGRDLLVLGDRRFLLVGGTIAYLFDPSGNAAGTIPGLAVVELEASVCDDGAIVSRGKVTRDLGATWQALISTGDLQLVAERGGCGGGHYWVLARSIASGYRLVKFDAAGTRGVAAGNWEATGDAPFGSGGPPVVRTSDGTFLVAGLAWNVGQEAWTLRDTPSRVFASGDTLFGVAKPSFYTSLDGGQTWTDAKGSGLAADEPEAFARGLDGALYVGRFTGEKVGGTDMWHSTVWKSSDAGTTWTVAYDAMATRPEGGEIAGEVHRFVGITATGAWIATDAVSRDAGATWTSTGVKGDRSLAYLTAKGSLISTLPGSPDVWRVYDEGGLGDLTATYTIQVDGAVTAASQLRSVAFDELGYAYVARGAPYVQLWRSTTPVD
ncbi:MAG: exo-alpha-sialidase [Deltaproteobacteria bacterium]|nr:exo-alpha-sialidase [Deltaproteobacteria bacterium]